MKKEELDMKMSDVLNKPGLDKTFREHIHELDRKVYGESFALSDECLNQMSDLELSELLGKLEFLSND